MFYFPIKCTRIAACQEIFYIKNVKAFYSHYNCNDMYGIDKFLYTFKVLVIWLMFDILLVSTSTVQECASLWIFYFH